MHSSIGRRVPRPVPILVWLGGPAQLAVFFQTAIGPAVAAGVARPMKFRVDWGVIAFQLLEDDFCGVAFAGRWQHNTVVLREPPRSGVLVGRRWPGLAFPVGYISRVLTNGCLLRSLVSC